MKKVFILMSSLLVAGCFICHKVGPKTEEEVTVESAAKMTVDAASASEQKVIGSYFCPEAASFVFGSSELKGENKLGELEQDIQANPDAMIIIKGHTDNVGNPEYNKRLSYQRAQAVAKAIEEKGYPNEIRLYGMGDTEPIASNDTAAGRAQNRRVDVELVRNLGN